MTSALYASHPLDADARWDALSRLSRALTAGASCALERALDALADALSADRVAILAGPHAADVLCARRAGKSLESEHADVCRSVVDDALATDGAALRRCEPEREDSIVELGIVSAMAAPLRTLAGVLYADFRHPLRQPGPSERELLECAASLIGAAIRPRTSAVSSPDGPRDVEISLDALLAAPGLRTLRTDLEACQMLETPILITGESGTGKTLLASALAVASGRTPVVRAMLGASDDLNTIASELFGHERGAFSGATTKRVGLVELADGGTLVLDEVLNLPLHAQQLLLDLTQFGTYRPLGWQGVEPKRVRVRIVAATNGDLERAVREGRFRQDLYYRLAGTVIRMPSLRERRADIPALALAALRRIDPARRWSLSVGASRLLRSPRYDWPGNVRELEAVIARARVRALRADPSARQLRPEDIDPSQRALDEVDAPQELAIDGGADTETLGDAWARLARERGALEAAERTLLEAALAAHGGVLAHAARALGLPRTTLISRLARAGLAAAGTATPRSR